MTSVIAGSTRNPFTDDRHISGAPWITGQARNDSAEEFVVLLRNVQNEVPVQSSSARRIGSIQVLVFGEYMPNDGEANSQ